LTKRRPRQTAFLDGIEILTELSEPTIRPIVAKVSAERPTAVQQTSRFPWLLEPKFAREKCFSLESFPVVSTGDELSNGIRFCHEYLTVAMNQPPKQMYAEECIFSMTAEHSEDGALAMYREVSSNCITGREARLTGREAVCDGLKEVFPMGFKCKVMEIHETDLDIGMKIVVFHGVFVAGDDGEILGFDRTFVLQDGSGITNDHIVVRDPPEWES
jgi:hypothetical protein